MAFLHISLPEAVTRFVKEQVEAGGYNDASEYLRELVLADRKRKAKEHLEAMMTESLDSGEAIETTEEWWAGLRDEIAAQRKPS